MSQKPKPDQTLVPAGSEQHYDVGYSKPPMATRFKPGRSGNPLGRPAGSRNASKHALNDERLKSIILDEAYRTISVHDANGPITVPMAQAVVRSMAVNAAKGNQRAQRLFTELISKVERENKELHDRWLDSAIAYKTEWERELERRKRLGINASDPIPHPDHIVIDMHTGTVRVTGPLTKEEKVVFDLVQANDPASADRIAELEKLIARRPNMAIAQRLGLPRENPEDLKITRIERVIIRPSDTNKVKNSCEVVGRENNSDDDA